MNVQPFFGSFPVIDLGDIVLRDIRVEDAGAYLDYMSNDQMAGFLTKENRPQSFDAAVEEVSYWKENVNTVATSMILTKNIFFIYLPSHTCNNL